MCHLLRLGLSTFKHIKKKKNITTHHSRSPTSLVPPGELHRQATSAFGFVSSQSPDLRTAMDGGLDGRLAFRVSQAMTQAFQASNQRIRCLLR